MAVVIHDIEQGSPEWQELRDGLYTGANADKLLSHSSKLKIVDGIVSKYAITEITGFGGNFYTKRGHILEDEALELYEAITKHTVSRPGFVTNTKYPACGFSPDGYDETIGLPLEVKAFEEVKHLKMYDGVIPVKVEAQIHYGQLIWEKKGSRLIIYNPNFAKKNLDGVPNQNYDPSKAIKIIAIGYNPRIQQNFKRILKGVK